MKATEVIIVGAGIVGCSIAYHLARMGCRKVIVLEKNDIGSGSTERCAGGIRQQFSTEVNIQLSMESVRFFEHFEEETGYPADFRQFGYMILATTEQELEDFGQNVALQNRLGVATRLLSPQEVGEIVPGLYTGDVLGASYCPTDGYADPYSAVQGFARAARNLGVKIYQSTEVTGISRSVRTWQVLTSKEIFQAPVLVLACGAYSGQVGRMVGLDIPVHAMRRHIFVAVPTDEIPRHSPMVVDFHNGFWFRREGTGIIFGMRNPAESEGFDISIDWGFLPVVAETASHRLPFMMDIGIERGQAGLHEDTPDTNAILGKISDERGLYLACGFSGHGFMHAPAVGRVMAELILNGRTTPDISCFTLDRFKAPGFQKREALFI